MRLRHFEASLGSTESLSKRERKRKVREKKRGGETKEEGQREYTSLI